MTIYKTKLIGIIGLIICMLFAFQSQPLSAQDAQMRVEIVQWDAGFPLSLEVAPDGRLFYVARELGAIMVNHLERNDDGEFTESEVVLDGLPTPIGAGDGIISMTLDPDFADNHYFYVYYTEIDDDGITQRVPIVRYTEQDGVAIDETIIVDNLPTNPNQHFHFGGALSFGPDGKLYLIYGDMDDSTNAADLEIAGGSILRFNPDGSIPDDNPFEDSPIYSYGHRNGFGLAWHPDTSALYESENGMFCDDEINLIEAGQNYGWGEVAPETCPYPDDVGVAPLQQWTPNIAPTGMIFYDGDMLADLQGHLLMCAFNNGLIHRIELSDDGKSVVDAIPLQLGDLGAYCQLDLAQDSDGAIYTATTNFILRIGQ